MEESSRRISFDSKKSNVQAPNVLKTYLGAFFKCFILLCTHKSFIFYGEIKVSCGTIQVIYNDLCAFMIEVFKLQLIEDDIERAKTLAVIVEREAYYEELFINTTRPPRITVRFEGTNPWQIRISFFPRDGRAVIIDTQGYNTADAVTKHAFKKLRRTAKNYFVKTKKRHRE